MSDNETRVWTLVVVGACFMFLTFFGCNYVSEKELTKRQYLSTNTLQRGTFEKPFPR